MRRRSLTQLQLGHVNLGITSVYLDGIDTAEIIDTVDNRRPPVISASAGLMIQLATALSATTPMGKQQSG